MPARPSRKAIDSATEVHRWATADPQDVAWSADGALVHAACVDRVVAGRAVGNLAVLRPDTGALQLFATCVRRSTSPRPASPGPTTVPSAR